MNITYIFTSACLTTNACFKKLLEILNIVIPRKFVMSITTIDIGYNI